MNVDTALLDHPLKISECNALIAETLKTGFYNLALEGEISGFKPSSSGHFYFSLKDEKSKISAVMFKTRQYNLDFLPDNGDFVTVYGNIEVYVPYGTYQIVVDKMVRKGTGDLLAQIEKLKQYYQNLGYFDIKNKRIIPKYPKRLVVITASTGAAIRDILQITKRRAPGLDIIILPTLVQGEEAPNMIASRIKQADSFLLGDLIILGRGGGSPEDLACFSSPQVIEAMHNCEIPIISAVGHENDWVLSDYIASLRASTPSAAAELATQAYKEVSDKIEKSHFTISSTINAKLMNAQIKLKEAYSIESILKQKLNYAKFTLEKANKIEALLKGKLNKVELLLSYEKENKIHTLEKKLTDAKNKIASAKLLIQDKLNSKLKDYNQSLKEMKTYRSYQLTSIYKEKSNMLEKEKTKIESFNPYAIIKRGYSILKDEYGNIIKTTQTGLKAQVITAIVSDGKLMLKNIGDNK